MDIDVGWLVFGATAFVFVAICAVAFLIAWNGRTW